MVKTWIKDLIGYYIRKFEKINGWLTKKEALGLFLLALKMPKNATVVEIGSWQGKSTYCLAKGLQTGKIYAIDPFNAEGGFDEESEKIYITTKGTDDLYDKFVRNMSNLKVNSKITAKRGYSYQYHDEFDKIDLLFIDGDHSIKGCEMDYNLYSQKIVIGGYIAFHDYDKTRPELGPTYVVENIIKKSDFFEYYKQYDSLWIAKKIN